MFVRRTASLALLALVAAAGPAAAQRATVIRDVRVFDGTRVIPSATVVVRDGVIASVGAAAAVPEGAEVVDGAGRTLLPGLIDTHTHTFAPGMLEQSLSFGVSTQVDMFTMPELAAIWREQGAGQVRRRADILSAGVWPRRPAARSRSARRLPLSRAGGRAAVGDTRIAEGSDFIKAVMDDGKLYGIRFNTLDEATLTAVVAAAHARGKIAVVHVATLAATRAAVRAGADGLVHVWMDSVPDAALVAEMARRRMFIIPTLAVSQAVTGAGSGGTLIRDARLGPMIAPEQRTALEARFQANGGSYAAATESIARLRAAGIRILAGTDAPNPGTIHGASMHHELELLVAAGLTPLQALQAPPPFRGRVRHGGPRTHRAGAARGPGAGAGRSHGGRHGHARARPRVEAGHPVDLGAVRARVAALLSAAARPAAAPAAAGGLGRRLRIRLSRGAVRRRWLVTTDAMRGGTSHGHARVADGGAEGTARRCACAASWARSESLERRHALSRRAAHAAAPTSRPRGSPLRAKGDGRTYTVLVFTARGDDAGLPSSPPARSGRRTPSRGATSADPRARSDGHRVDGQRTARAYELWLDQVELP